MDFTHQATFVTTALLTIFSGLIPCNRCPLRYAMYMLGLRDLSLFPHPCIVRYLVLYFLLHH